MFTLSQLQAISDWQQGGDAQKKHHQGLALKAAVQSLPIEFRQCGLVAFRKISLKKSPLWKLLAEEKLPETISAWTLATDVAKAFKDGVSKTGQSVILECAPGTGNVVVNLSKLYASDEFNKAIDRFKNSIARFELGMGRYRGTQAEVVIEKAALASNDVYALGGHSSEPQEIGRVIFGRDPSEQEVSWMRTLLQKQGQDFGPWWIEGSAKDRAVARTQSHVPELKAIQSRQRSIRRGAKGR